MPIYLHRMSKQPDYTADTDGIEIDLVSWESHKEGYPYGITLLRKLSNDTRQPYLQELMFKSLYQNVPIKNITLDIPCADDTSTVNTYQLFNVKVIDYTLHPQHSHKHKAYERVSLLAEKKATKVALSET